MMRMAGKKSVEIESVADSCLKIIREQAQGTQYSDCRVVCGKTFAATSSQGEEAATENEFFGVAFRALVNGNWGFASTNNPEKSSLSHCLQSSVKLAKSGKGDAAIKEEHVPTYAKKFDLNGFDATYSLVIDDVYNIAKKAREIIESEKEVSTGRVFLSAIAQERVVLNPYGLFAHEKLGRQRAFLEASAKRKGDTQSAHESMGNVGNPSCFGQVEMLAPKCAKKAQKMLDATLPPKGTFTVIVDGKMAGVLAHEAVGHASEGDTVASGGSVLEGKLGKTIANKNISISDSPAASGYGAYAFDDEGTLAGKTYIVKNGIFSGYLTSLETAASLKAKPSGNCRAGGYSQFPIVRMSNTYIDAGNAGEQEVFDVKYGLYLKGMKGGSVDPVSGDYVFAADEGYIIENGQLGQLLRDCTLSGNVLVTLKNVEAVGKGFESSPGMCGKSGQSVPVCDGGPHIRIAKVTLG